MNAYQRIVTTLATLTTALSAFCAGTLSPSGSGLLPAEIVSHDVTVTINNGFAQTEVTQQFRNNNDSTVEATYSFPVPQSASLSECHVQVGEQLLEGEGPVLFQVGHQIQKAGSARGAEERIDPESPL